MLARVVGALAARRDLSVDRVSDAVLITDAIAGGGARALRRRPRAGSASTSARGASTCASGRWSRARRASIREELEVPDVGGSLEALADELTVEESDDGEYLVIRFAAAP